MPIRSIIQTTIHANTYNETQYLPILTCNFTDDGGVVGATIRALFWPYSKPGYAYSYISFTSFCGGQIFGILDGWIAQASVTHHSMQEGPELWRMLAFSTTTCAPEDTDRVSSGQSFKRSYGNWALSYLPLRAAKGGATNFPRPIAAVSSLFAAHRTQHTRLYRRR